MYLTYISDYDQNLKMSQFVLVRYQGAKISEDRKKIEPQYFEAYLQLKPEVSKIEFMKYRVFLNVSSDVEFQRWWVLKSKIFWPRINMLK